MPLCNSERELTKMHQKLPYWVCGVCRRATLVQSRETLVHEPPLAVDERINHPDWDHEWRREYFAAFYDCPDCQRGTIASGRILVKEDYDDNLGSCLVSLHEIQAFTVAPAIIRVDAELPDDVEARLRETFTHYWTDPDACGNAIRRLVETVLNNKKVKRFVINTKRKRVELSPHSRIENHLNPSMFPAKEYLLALKWGGNSGSHGNGLSHSREELLEMFELLEEALLAIYGEDKRKALSKRAAAIIDRKGKPSKLTKRRQSARASTK